jgi:hypothetical protein
MTATNVDRLSHCHGPGCDNTNLIKAHIVPQWVGRYIDSPHGANVVITPRTRTRKLPHGIFDQNILCDTCDGYLNTHYDDPASEVFRRLRITHKNMNMRQTRFTKRGVNCDLICRFFLSILWRASISTRSECFISLGEYEDEVRDVLFGIKPPSSLSGFAVIVVRYISNITDPTGLYTLPVTRGHLGYDTYHFSFAGFRVTMKIDPHPFPSDWYKDVLNGRDVLRGYVTNFESSPEGRKAHKMILDADRPRKTP